MKIGVYGDSFACQHTTVESATITWYNMLANFIPNSTVKSYGWGATSLFYSYKSFLKTYHEFDKIIFLVTNPDRYTKEVEFTTGRKEFFANIFHTDHILKNNKDLSSIDIRIINDLKGWFMSLDSEYNSLMSEFMIQNMEKLHNDIIFFPCFPSSLTDERLNMYKLTSSMNMINIFDRQKQLLNNADLWAMDESKEHISCHLSEEFNLFVAKLFANKILKNQWNWHEMYDVKLTHDLNYYFSFR